MRSKMVEINLSEAKKKLQGYAKTLQETREDVQRLIGRRDAVLSRLADHGVSSKDGLSAERKKLEKELASLQTKLRKKMEEIDAQFIFD
jgi:hypothetical protein